MSNRQMQQSGSSGMQPQNSSAQQQPATEINGIIRLRLDNISSMEAEQKYTAKALISRFNWELIARKSFPILTEQRYNEIAEAVQQQQQQNIPAQVANADNEEEEVIDLKPEPFLNIKLNCAESKCRLAGWKCTVDLGMIVTGAKKTRTWHTSGIQLPWENYGMPVNSSIVKIPWNELFNDYLGSQQNWLEIEASISITEQIGYGLLPLNDVLVVNECRFFVNKAYLAAYSPFFRALFFSPALDGGDGGEHQITDPTDNLSAFKLMLKIAVPKDTEPTDELIVDVLHLADKYDLPNVTEICEEFLINKSRLPTIQKLGMADQYNLINLKKSALEKIKPLEFCKLLDESIQIYNELSPSMRQQLSRQMKRRASDADSNEAGPSGPRRVRFNDNVFVASDPLILARRLEDRQRIVEELRRQADLRRQEMEATIERHRSRSRSRPPPAAGN